MVKSWKFWTVLAAAFALGGWAWKKHKAAGPADTAAPVEVARGDLEKHFVDSGEIAPKNFVDVASQVSGRVVTMKVDEGNRVKKGDELCVIQPGRSEAERYVPTSVKAPIDGVVMRYQKQGGNDPSALQPHRPSACASSKAARVGVRLIKLKPASLASRNALSCFGTW